MSFSISFLILSPITFFYYADNISLGSYFILVKGILETIVLALVTGVLIYKASNNEKENIPCFLTVPAGNIAFEGYFINL